MAWRLADSVVHGEIDNRTRGIVRGKVWLQGSPDPVVLELEGNPASDLMGCHLVFRRRSSSAEEPNLSHGPNSQNTQNTQDPQNSQIAGGHSDALLLNMRQSGLAGEITAARKVRVLPKTAHEAEGDPNINPSADGAPDTGTPDTSSQWLRWLEQGKPISSLPLANLLYVEWFSKANGRVVLELVDFELTISEPAWQPTDSMLLEESAPNTATQELVDQLEEEFDATEFDMETEHSLSEFEWEAIFRESDRFAEKATELFEKYSDDPDFEEILSRELGWEIAQNDEDPDEEEPGFGLGTGLPESFDTGVDTSAWDQSEDWAESHAGISEESHELRLPDPEREGVHWVCDRHGHILHPFAKRILDCALAWRRGFVEMGSLKEGEQGLDGVPVLRDLILELQHAGTRCAGALQGLAYAENPHQPGFMVARLKRALRHLHLAMGSLQGAQEAGWTKDPQAQEMRMELFAFRTEVLDWMKRIRSGDLS